MHLGMILTERHAWMTLKKGEGKLFSYPHSPSDCAEGCKNRGKYVNSECHVLGSYLDNEHACTLLLYRLWKSVGNRWDLESRYSHSSLHVVEVRILGTAT